MKVGQFLSQHLGDNMSKRPARVRMAAALVKRARKPLMSKASGSQIHEDVISESRELTKRTDQKSDDRGSIHSKASVVEKPKEKSKPQSILRRPSVT